MTDRTTYKYEIAGWRDASKQRKPDEMELTDSVSDARTSALDMNRRCERVEVKRIGFADGINWSGEIPIASWTFGILTS